MADDGSPQSLLYYFNEESWNRFTQWALNPTPLRIGHTAFNLTIAQRILTPGKWLGNEEMDAMMYMWRENTTLRRWNIKRPTNCRIFFFLTGEESFRNHWISVCVNIIEKKVEAFDYQRGRNRQYVEKFVAVIPRIVKAVAPPERKKQLLLSPYYIVDVPIKSRLNKSCADCGVYALNYLECLLLGLDLSLVDDEIMQGCRQKIALDIWEAAQDPMIIQLMAEHVSSGYETSDVFDIEED
ncbi:BnaC02g25460D [Brassica napus]|uniref:BnaC02g25460D protein n=1 Tax=Brassica napus TaxID=3708 RepID=A0A078GAZ4_BRANA|nr:BnaC02g25460D [Brassica napus]